MDDLIVYEDSKYNIPDDLIEAEVKKISAKNPILSQSACEIAAWWKLCDEVEKKESKNAS